MTRGLYSKGPSDEFGWQALVVGQGKHQNTIEHPAFFFLSFIAKEAGQSKQQKRKEKRLNIEKKTKARYTVVRNHDTKTPKHLEQITPSEALVVMQVIEGPANHIPLAHDQ